jgi:hypothetical protein
MAELLTGLAFGIDLEQIGLFARDAWASGQRWAVEGYGRAPAVMIGLAIVGMLPLLSLAGYLAHRIRAAEAPVPVKPADAEGLAWPKQAWITVDGGAGGRWMLPRELLSIGREEDNDLRLDHATVHRHHAVLQRTSDARFIICDLSGASGNGIKVNGSRVAQAALADGDRIEVGAVVLDFETQPA